jgi:hypothetical protein
VNRSEATGVVNLISATWPSQEMEADTIAIWMSVLGFFEHADARIAVGLLMRTEHFLPSIAKFTEAVEAEAHARRNREASSRGLSRAPASVPSPERFAEVMAGLRNQLRERGSRKHWHGGPDPCPICGGLPADWQRKHEKERAHDQT